MRRILSVLAVIPAIFFATACGDAPKASSGADITLTSVDCSSCAIVLDTIASITDSPSDAISFIATPVVDSRGRIVVANAKENGLLVFDSTGAQIATWGKAGGGPGELESVNIVALLPGDTIAVFDQSRETILYFAGDYKFAHEKKTGDFECCLPPLVLPGGRFLIGQDGGTAVTIASDGTVSQLIRLIPIDTSGGKGNCEACGPTVLGASSAGGAYWAARVNEYKVRLVDTAGVVIRSISRAAPWFVTWTADSQNLMSGVMPPRLVAVHEVPDSILWIVVIVAKEVKQAAAPSQLMHDGELSGKAIGQMLSRHETRVEAIDLTTGKLVASQAFPAIFMILRSGHTAIIRIDSSGDPHWSIGKLRLNGLNRSKN